METEPSKLSIKIELKDFLVKGKFGDTTAEDIGSDKKQEIDEENSLTHFRGTIKMTLLEEEVLAEFSINYTAETICARCLKKFERNGALSFEREYLIGKRIPQDDKMLIDKQFRIEVGEPVEEEISFDIPMKPLCSESCEGFTGND